MTKQYHPRLASLLNYFENHAISSSHSSESQQIVHTREPRSHDSKQSIHISDLNSNGSDISNTSESSNSHQSQSVACQVQTQSQEKLNIIASSAAISPKNKWQKRKLCMNQSNIRDEENDSLKEVNSEEIFDFLQSLKDFHDSPVDDVQNENTANIHQPSEHQEDNLVVRRSADPVLGSVGGEKNLGSSSIRERHRENEYRTKTWDANFTSTVPATSYPKRKTVTILEPLPYNNMCESPRLKAKQEELNQYLGQNNTIISSNSTTKNSPGLRRVLYLQANPIKDRNSLKSLESLNCKETNTSNIDSNRTRGSRFIEKNVNNTQSPSTDDINIEFDTSLLSPTSRLIVFDLWSDQKETVINALVTLAKSANSIKGKREILDCGGHLAIIQILKKWSMSAEVVFEACNSLEKTARFASFVADALVLVGGLQVILYCLKEYGHIERIQGSGCSALCAIAWSRKNADFLVFKLHALTAFTDAIIAFPYSTIVLQNACWFFNHISNWSDFRKPLVAAGVLGALANAIETYTKDSNEDKIIQINAREALKKIVVT